MDPMVWLYLGFGAFVMVVMAVDLMVTRPGLVISTKRALTWTGICVALALAFVPVLYAMFDAHWLGLGQNVKGEVERTGFTAAAEYLTGWMLEYGLSVDNLFVFALIFRHFSVPKQYQHRVLTWGIIATLILRGVMILTANTLISRFEWVLYLAGAFLVYTAFKMLVAGEQEFDADKSRIVRVARRVVPLTPEFHQERFFVRIGGLWTATPLFLVLLVLNLVDVVFAVDSIPAIFSITRDPFIVFTSNVFAVLGLRALYFVLAHLMEQFKYLKVSLAVVLGFIGVKMLTEHFVHPYIPVQTLTFISLGFVAAALGLGVFFSVRKSPRTPEDLKPPLTPLGERDAT